MFCQTTNSGEKNILETNMNKVFLECLLLQSWKLLIEFLNVIIKKLRDSN